jgi:hypothetical protein
MRGLSLAVAGNETPCDHQPPEVNYIELLAKVDSPCRVHSEVYLLLDFSILENGPIVHIWWLVGVSVPAEHAGRRRGSVRIALGINPRHCGCPTVGSMDYPRMGYF